MRLDNRPIFLILFVVFILCVTFFIYKVGSIEDFIISEIGQSRYLSLQNIETSIKKTKLLSILTGVVGLSTILILLFTKASDPTITGSMESFEESHSNRENRSQKDITPTISRNVINKRKDGFIENLKNIDEYSDIKEYCRKVVTEIANYFEASHGAFYVKERDNENNDIIVLRGGYAFHKSDDGNHYFNLGEGLAGQVAKAKHLININNVPEGYISILSGLGSSSPKSLLIFPVTVEGIVFGVIEMASFKDFSPEQEKITETINEEIGSVLSDKFPAYFKTEE